MHITYPVCGSTLAFRFAGSKILQKYCYLLSFHATNSDHTNHCIVKMLHRVAVNLKLAPLLYQVTLFKTFQEILSSRSTRYKVRKCKEGSAKFCGQIVSLGRCLLKNCE